MPERNRVVITQPTYLPWLGYFHLMAGADTFIFLDNVQFDKRSWQQRNRVKEPGGAAWLTVPVRSKGGFHQLIKDVEIDGQGWQKKHLNTVKHLYAKSPFKKNVVSFLENIYHNQFTLLSELNMTIIREMAGRLEISPRFLTASELRGLGKKVELLVDLCVKTGATHYLSGLAAKGYIDENNLFEGLGIAVEYQDFPHPEYPQLHGSFISHLSIIDAVMNIGWEQTRKILMNTGIKDQ